MLEAITAPLAGAMDPASARAALGVSMNALARSANAAAGWARVHLERGDITATAEAGHGMGLFCFSALKAPECFCADALRGGAVSGAGGAGAFCTERGFASVICAPVTADGRAAGFIFLGFKDEASPEAAELAKSAALHAGFLASRLAESAAMERRLKTLETITRVGAIIASQLTLRELAQAVVEHLGKVLRTDRVNLVLYNPREEQLEFIASFISGEGTREPETYPLSDGMNSWIIRNRRPLLIREDSERECARMGIRHGGRPAKSWLGVPMLNGGRVIGALSVQCYEEAGRYDNASTDLLNLVAQVVAVAVANAQLYEAGDRREKEKQRLYYSLTHDLISFIAPINSYGEVLRRMDAETLAARKDDIGRQLIAAGKKVTQFVDDILLYSKLEAGRLNLQPSEVNIYNIINDSVSNFYSEMTMRKIDLYIEGEKYGEGTVRFPSKVVTCDTLHIERVLNNCIQNAMKHARRRVEVTTSADGGELLCTVRDDGDGMPKEDAPKVFDEYYQADHGKKGVGLGLPSVKRIVEQHGGRVWVETDSGKGFAFTFSLPVKG